MRSTSAVASRGRCGGATGAAARPHPCTERRRAWRAALPGGAAQEAGAPGAGAAGPRDAAADPAAPRPRAAGLGAWGDPGGGPGGGGDGDAGDGYLTSPTPGSGSGESRRGRGGGGGGGRGRGGGRGQRGRGRGGPARQQQRGRRDDRPPSPPPRRQSDYDQELAVAPLLAGHAARAATAQPRLPGGGDSSSDGGEPGQPPRPRPRQYGYWSRPLSWAMRSYSRVGLLPPREYADAIVDGFAASLEGEIADLGLADGGSAALRRALEEEGEAEGAAAAWREEGEEGEVEGEEEEEGGGRQQAAEGGDEAAAPPPAEGAGASRLAALSAVNALSIGLAALRVLGYADAHRWARLARAAAALAPATRAPAACSIARSLAAARAADGAALAALGRSIARGAAAGTISLEDASRALWACGEAVQPDRALLTALGLTVATLSRGLRDARGLNSVLWAYSRTRVPPPLELCAALGGGGALLRGAPARELSLLAWSVVRVQGQLSAAAAAELAPLLPAAALEARAGGGGGRGRAGGEGLARFRTEELATLLWSLAHGKVLDEKLGAAAAAVLGARYATGERVPLRAAVTAMWGLASQGCMTSPLLHALLRQLRRDARALAANGWLCSQALGALAMLRCKDAELAAALADALAPRAAAAGAGARRRPLPNWSAHDAAGAAGALAALGHAERGDLLAALLDSFLAASGRPGTRGAAPPLLVSKALRAAAVLDAREPQRLRGLLQLAGGWEPQSWPPTALMQLQQAVLWLQILTPGGERLVAGLLPEPLADAALAAWAEAAAAPAPSVTQAAVAAALRRLGFEPRSEELVGGGLFSADIALDYEGQPIAFEVCGPTHFLAPAAALAPGGPLGAAASAEDLPFGEALVAAAAGAAAAAAAAGAAAGAAGGRGAEGELLGYYGTLVLDGAGGGDASGSGEGAWEHGGGGGGLLELSASSVLRARLMEALGWRVAHLPFHLWAARGGGQDALLRAALARAAGAPPGVARRGGRGGARGGGGGRAPAAAAAAAARVAGMLQRSVAARGEARRAEARYAARRGPAPGPDDAVGHMAALAGLLAGLDEGGGGGGGGDLDDDLYLDPDLLAALPDAGPRDGPGGEGEGDEQGPAATRGKKETAAPAPAPRGGVGKKTRGHVHAAAARRAAAGNTASRGAAPAPKRAPATAKSEAAALVRQFEADTYPWHSPARADDGPGGHEVWGPAGWGGGVKMARFASQPRLPARKQAAWDAFVKWQAARARAHVGPRPHRPQACYLAGDAYRAMLRRGGRLVAEWSDGDGFIMIGVPELDGTITKTCVRDDPGWLPTERYF
ncbi:MAG: hypothetical protein J3K34DRAFT_512124 [Monoraphidium minutum]|nr:MAG: hypothetical protein J3K34DRAFT_512124 [Monoraphidium minutum]